MCTSIAFYSCHQMVSRQDFLLISARTRVVRLCSVTAVTCDVHSKSGFKRRTMGGKDSSTSETFKLSSRSSYTA